MLEFLNSKIILRRTHGFSEAEFRNFDCHTRRPGHGRAAGRGQAREILHQRSVNPLVLGQWVKATGEFCSVGSGGGNFYVDFIFGTDGRLTLDYECGSRTETLKSRWWVEEDELCLDLKDSSLIEIIPPVKPDGR